MKTKELNKKAFDYILNAINSEDYNVEATTDKEKLQFLADTFTSEYCFPANLKQCGSYQNVLAEWIMGLPTAFNIDFENYRIIEIAKEWGSIPADATERQEDAVIRQWFQFIAWKTLQLFKKHGVSL